MQNRNSSVQFALFAAGAAAVLALSVAALWLLGGRDRGIVDTDPDRRPGPAKPAQAEEGPRGPADPPPEDHAHKPPDRAENPAPGKTQRLLRGRVLDLEGNPIGDHRVVLALPLGMTDSMPAPAVLFNLAEQAQIHGWPSAITGHDGSFEILTDRMGPGAVLAGPPDYGEVHQEVTLSDDPAPVELRLDAGLAIAGRVCEKETGAGVEGVIVNAGQPIAPGRDIRRKTTTAADGSFSAGGFKPGSVAISLGLKGDRGLDLSRQSLWAQAGQRDILIHAYRFGHVELRAFIGRDRAPFCQFLQASIPAEPDAHVQVYNTSGNEYLLRGPAGSHDFLFTCPSSSVQPAWARLTIEAGRRIPAGAPVEFKEGHTLLAVLETPGHAAPEPEWWWGCVFIETLDPPLRRIFSKEVGRGDVNRSILRFDGLSRGPHRVVAAARGFGAVETTVLLSETETAVRLLLADAASAPRLGGKPFSERKYLMLDFTIPPRSNASEVVSLLAAVSDTALFLGPSIEARDLKAADAQMSNVSLADAVEALRRMWKLDFDPETGVFSGK